MTDIQTTDTGQGKKTRDKASTGDSRRSKTWQMVAKEVAAVKTERSSI